MAFYQYTSDTEQSDWMDVAVNCGIMTVAMLCFDSNLFFRATMLVLEKLRVYQMVDHDLWESFNEDQGEFRINMAARFMANLFIPVTWLMLEYLWPHDSHIQSLRQRITANNPVSILTSALVYIGVIAGCLVVGHFLFAWEERMIKTRLLRHHHLQRVDGTSPKRVPSHTSSVAKGSTTSLLPTVVTSRPASTRAFDPEEERNAGAGQKFLTSHGAFLVAIGLVASSAAFNASVRDVLLI